MFTKRAHGEGSGERRVGWGDCSLVAESPAGKVTEDGELVETNTGQEKVRDSRASEATREEW